MVRARPFLLLLLCSVFGLALASSAQAALLVSEQDVHLSYDTNVPIGAQPQVHITGTATATLDVYVSTISATDRCSGEFPSSWQVDRTYSVQAGDIDMTYVGSTQTALGPIRLCVWVYDRRDRSYTRPTNAEPLIDTTQVCTTAHGQLSLANGRVAQARIRVLKSHGRARVAARRLVNQRLKAADAAAKAIPESCAGHADVNAA